MLFSSLVGLKIEGAEGFFGKVGNFFFSPQKFDTPELQLAAEIGDIGKVRSLIASGANVDFNKPLLSALVNGRREIAQLLLISGARSDIRDKENFSLLGIPLMDYDTNRSIPMMRVLFDNGFKIDPADNDFNFYFAFKKRDDAVLNLLLDHTNPTSITDAILKKISDRVKNPDDRPFVHEELSKKLEQIQHQRYLEQEAQRRETEIALDAITRKTINNFDENGYTPLMNAANDGNLDQVVKLLELGADVNVVNEDGFSALLFALNPHNTHAKQIVNALLEADADTAVVGEEILNEILTLED